MMRCWSQSDLPNCFVKNHSIGGMDRVIFLCFISSYRLASLRRLLLIELQLQIICNRFLPLASPLFICENKKGKSHHIRTPHP